MHAKEWRALPQDVALSGDTKSGTRRLFGEILRKFSVVLLVGGIASLFVYVWLDMMSGFSEEKSGPIAVAFESDGGMLDETWFRSWTEFDENSAPNLHHLRDRIMAYPQVSAARVMRLPSTIFLLTSLVPLVPGYNFYRAMLALVEDNGMLAASQMLVAVQIVAAIAVGAAVTSVVFRMLAQHKRRKPVQ